MNAVWSESVACKQKDRDLLLADSQKQCWLDVPVIRSGLAELPVNPTDHWAIMTCID